MTITVVLPSKPPMKPVLRSMRFDIPLDKYLSTSKIGKIVGSRTGVNSCDIDIEVAPKSLDKAILGISKKLKKLDCPVGTRILQGTFSRTVR